MADEAPAAPGGLSSSIPTVAPEAAPRPKDPGVEQETGQPFGPTTGIAHPIPIPAKQAEWESGYQNEHGPRPSRWDAWVSTPFQEGAHATLASPWGGALLRMAQDQSMASGKIISADDANKLYPDRPVPYTTPVDRGTALMEYNDRARQRALSDWAAQRPVTTLGKIVSTASGFAGGITDPLNFAIGAASSGVGELMTPEAAGMAGKVAAHYLSNLGGFSVTDALQNMAEHQMGAKQKQFGEVIGENAVPAAIMTGVGIGLGAIARRFANEGGGTSEADIAGVKRTVSDLEQDRKPPQLEDLRAAVAERRAGVSQPQGPSGDKVNPTILTSPLQETQLYGAAHSDGTPLVHEHGLGKGIQLTDSHEVANNGVSRSTETPGQIAETRLPEGTKLLNIDQPASSEPALVKALEEKTGVTINPQDSLKDVITNLGDWAGVEHGKISVPESILSDIQDIAKAQGYAGYEFAGQNSRQAHLFDPSSLSASKAYSATPATTPGLPEPPGAQPQVAGAQTEQFPSPGMDKTQDKFYSPEVEKLVHEYRKGKVFDPSAPEALAETQKDIEMYKQQLKDMADKGSVGTPKKLLSNVNDFMGVANRVASVPTEEFSLKDGTKVSINVEMRGLPLEMPSGQTIELQKPTIVARNDSGQVVGTVAMGGEYAGEYTGKEGQPFHIAPSMVEVPEEFRRKGIASAMYDYGNKHVAEMKNSGLQSDLGQQFRAAYDQRQSGTAPPKPLSNTAQEALDSLRKQETQDARLRDIAKRISECGSGGGV